MKSKFLNLGLFVVVIALIGVGCVYVSYTQKAKQIEVKEVITVVLEDDYVKDWRVIKDEEGNLIAVGNVTGNGETRKYLDEATVQIEYKTMDANGDITTEVVEVAVTLQMRDSVSVRLPIKHYDRVVFK